MRRDESSMWRSKIEFAMEMFECKRREKEARDGVVGGRRRLEARNENLGQEWLL